MERRVDRVGSGVRIKLGYAVRFSDGRQGYISPEAAIFAESENEHQARVDAQKECERRGWVRIGMTKEQVYASCLGEPQAINTTTTLGGTREQLIYRNGVYVYLDAGIVTAIQESQTRR